MGRNCEFRQLSVTTTHSHLFRFIGHRNEFACLNRYLYASRLIPSFLLYEFKEDEGAARRERAGETRHIAYENALIRRPRIIYISINVRCNRQRNEKPIHIIKCALLYIR